MNEETEENKGQEVRNGHKRVIVAGQSAAMSGYAIWGHDTGWFEHVAENGGKRQALAFFLGV